MKFWRKLIMRRGKIKYKSGLSTSRRKKLRRKCGWWKGKSTSSPFRSKKTHKKTKTYRSKLINWLRNTRSHLPKLAKYRTDSVKTWSRIPFSTIAKSEKVLLPKGTNKNPSMSRRISILSKRGTHLQKMIKITSYSKASRINNPLKKMNFG